MRSYRSLLLQAIAPLSSLLYVSPSFAEPPPQCEQINFTVTLSQDDTTPYQVAAWLCGQGSIQNATLQVLLHGATYGHIYWDWPQQPELYSYVRAMTGAGYATLAIDRIGIGASDHPPAEAVTLRANAFVVHQIVQAMRQGRFVPGFGPVQSNRVMLVGHSLGSLISMLEASSYADVDGVILSGVSHSHGPGQDEIAASFYPVQFDARFASLNLPFGYLTTLPGTRGSGFFYFQDTTDPAVVALDEATKETVTTGEFSDFLDALASSSGIHAPVLNVLGDRDTIFCPLPSCTTSGVLSQEQQFYALDTCFQSVAIPATSHNLNLHRTAPLWYAKARHWADIRVGADSRLPPLKRCH